MAPRREDDSLLPEAAVAAVVSLSFVVALFIATSQSDIAVAPGYLFREWLAKVGLRISRVWALPLTMPPWWLVFFLSAVLVRMRRGA